MSQDRSVCFPGTNAQFTQITREAFNRYRRKASFYSDLLDWQQYTKGATLKYLTDAWECYILGLLELCAAECGRAFEEHLAWKWFDRARDQGKGFDEAYSEIRHKRLGRLIYALRETGELPREGEDARKIDLILHMRNYGSHAARIMALKTLVDIHEGTTKGTVLSEVVKQEVEYPADYLQLASLLGIEVDPKALSVRHLINDDSLLKLLETTIEMIKKFPAEGGTISRFGPLP